MWKSRSASGSCWRVFASPCASAAPRKARSRRSWPGAVEIDLEKRLVTRDGAVVKVSPREYDVLARLAQARGKVLTHKDLLTAVWGPAHAHDTQYLRVFVGQLRQKLEADPSTPKMILTEPGIGYRFIGD